MLETALKDTDPKRLQMLSQPSHLDIQKLWEIQKKQAVLKRDMPIKHRLMLLKKLENATLSYEERLQNAVFKDFGRAQTETRMLEIYPSLSEVRYAIKKLPKWSAKHAVGKTLITFSAKAWTVAEPKGVTLIISPWNYPVFLTLGPLVSALAAGNTAILKTSELTPHTSEVLQELIYNTFNPEDVAVVQGHAETAQALLELPFDHIFFTGSTQVGSIIMQKAAQHLSSVTLELGGKSPTIVDQTANIEDAAKKIVWGKFVNAGQTCIAPDFLMVHESVTEKLEIALVKELDKRYPDPAPHHDLAKIVSDKHYLRLKNAIQEAIDLGAKPITPIHTNDATRSIAPTLLKNVPLDTLLMREEIFGPVLPILTYKSITDLVKFLTSRRFGKPLALYLFSESQVHQEQILARVSAGGVCINDCLIHLAHKKLPFGGVNQSGIGKSKGEYGFWEFSNRKSVIRQWSGFSPFSLFFSPYTDKVKVRLEWFFKSKI
ncbi:MAG: aldehyde dehydrogenase family protein [Cytophagales bacterium]|nr:MAG: aldehyde dehydrogenase family protein [Cytophagales bacterium]TAF61530.1 MAG: aldehyde dehydrogenase family protein [Cytophagales bacterium]